MRPYSSGRPSDDKNAATQQWQTLDVKKCGYTAVADLVMTKTQLSGTGVAHEEVISTIHGRKEDNTPNLPPSVLTRRKTHTLSLPSLPVHMSSVTS
jgi:hypothetical protein